MSGNDTPSQETNRPVRQLFHQQFPSTLRDQRFWTIITLAAILVILFYQSLFCGKGLLPSDGIFRVLPWSRTTDSAPSNYLLADQYNVFIPQHQFVRNRIMKGDFPLWNPHLSCGLPNLASIQGALLFPIQLVLSPLDPFYAAGIAAFLKLFLAGLFTMLYLRRLGASSIASLLSGLIFSLSGFMIVWLGHPQVNCAMWLPLLLYLIEGQYGNLPQQDQSAAKTASLRGWVGFAIAYGFMLLGGHPPTAIHATILIVCYFFFRLAGNNRGKRLYLVLSFLCSLIAGMLLAAPQLLPYFEYYNLSSSALSSDALNRWKTHLDVNNLIHFLLPYVSGSPVIGFEDLPRLLGLDGIDNFNERTGYVGIVTILLASCAVFYRRCKFSYFFLTTAVLSMLIVFGIPPFPLIMSQLPILQYINHTRLLMMVTFSLAVLAGLGADTLSKTENRSRILILVAGFWAVIGVLLVWFCSVIWPNLSELDGPHRAFLFLQLPMLAGSLIISIMVILRPQNKWPMFIIIVCLTWTTADLLWFAGDYNPNISRARHYPSTSVIEFLKKDSSHFRIMGLGDILGPNTAAAYGLYDVRGYDFMSVRRYEKLITGTAGNFFFYSYAQHLPPVFPLLNVKYVIAPQPVSVEADQFELVYSKEVAVYRYKPSLERALVVFDYKVFPDTDDILSIVRSESFKPREVLLLEEKPKPEDTMKLAPASETAVSIVSYQPDDIIIDASLPRPGFLLLLDTYFPGWQATVNGESTRIYRADYNFRAVSLPSGRSVVRFTYKPSSLLLGFILFLVGTLVLVIAWFRHNTGRSKDLS
jgi:membrane protein YfhO